MPGRRGHGPDDRQKIAAYGWGGKTIHAVYAYDPQMPFGFARFSTTNSLGHRFQAIQDYGKIIHDDLDVSIPDVNQIYDDDSTSDGDAQTGSVLYIEGGRAIKSLIDNISQVKSALGEIYRPAINSGFKLYVNDELIRAPQVKLVGKECTSNLFFVDNEIEYHFTLTYGETSERHMASRFSIACLGRVINYGEYESLGIDAMPATGFYGEIALGEIVVDGKVDHSRKWPLGGVKDFIDGEFRSNIRDTITSDDGLMSLLLRLKQKANDETIELEEERDNELIAMAFGSGKAGKKPIEKERRDKGIGGSGTIKPVNTGIKRVPKKVRVINSGDGAEGLAKKSGKPLFRIRRAEGKNTMLALQFDYEAKILNYNVDSPGIAEFFKDPKFNSTLGESSRRKRIAMLSTLWCAFEPFSGYDKRQLEESRSRAIRQFGASIARLFGRETL